MSNARKNESTSPSDVLKGLFSIGLEQLEVDLSLAKRDVSRFRLKERNLQKRSRIGLNDAVKSVHRRLIIASQMFRSSRLPADLILFSSTQMAHEVAEMSCAAATGKGQLSEFTQIFERSGCEFYFEESFVKESDRLLTQIHDMVVVEVLKRYQLPRYAALFEQNRPLYEIRFEVGRRLVVPDLVGRSEHLEILEQYQIDYCPDIVREFLRRLEKHDLLPA